MAFESTEAVGDFYKAYAHNVGFSVRIGQKKTVENWAKSRFSNEGGGTQEGCEWREDKNTMWL
jgi:hypothetical protein